MVETKVISCRACGKKLKSITQAHVHGCSGISLQIYKERYPNAPLVTEEFRRKSARPLEKNGRWKGKTGRKCRKCGNPIGRNGKTGYCHPCISKIQPNPFSGKTHSEETRIKMRDASKKRLPETRKGGHIPFEIASAIRKAQWAKLPPKKREATIVRLIQAGRNAKRKSEKTEIEIRVSDWLHELGIKFENNKPIGRHNVDIMIGTNLAIECYGDFWHANPGIYDLNWLNPETKVPAHEKRWQDYLRKITLSMQGIELLILWEHTILKNPEEAKSQIREFIKKKMTTYKTGEEAKAALIQKGEAEWILPLNGMEPAQIFATEALLQDMSPKVFEQLMNAASMPSVQKITLTPDAHQGMGVPVGCTIVSKDSVFPSLVGPDICCSMSYMQTNLPAEAVKDKPTRRALIDAICERVPTGANNRLAVKGRGQLSEALMQRIVINGPDTHNLRALGIPEHWAEKCEAPAPNIDLVERLLKRWEELQALDHKPGYLRSKIRQLGSYGGGNHFGEAQVTEVTDETIGNKFGLLNGRVGFLSHCGSRGFGYRLADRHFRGLEEHFQKWHIPFPGGDKELVYAPTDSPEGQNYLLDMTLGAHMATVNHLLLNQLVCEAFNEVLGPQFDADFVYHISHNIGREELWKDLGGGRWAKGFVWRKGATRAFPGTHPALDETPYDGVGHPILLPGNPAAGSRIMVAAPGASKSCYSINHGAGRAMGRKEAHRTITQEAAHKALELGDVLFNGRNYPVDEAPQAYKDFNEVCGAVEKADLAKTVAKLRAVFVIKDNDQDKEGSA